MSFHLLKYNTTTGGAVTLRDMTAVADGEFSPRNGHYMFTEAYRLLAMYSFGATQTQMRLMAPHITGINPFFFHPLNLSLTVPTNPTVNDFRFNPIPLPQSEEIAVEVSDSANEIADCYLWIAGRDWSMNLPRGIQRQTILATASVTTVLSTWAGATPIVPTYTLKGGWYAIVGARCVAAATHAFRLIFPRQPLVDGRRYRPGDLATQTFGLIPNALGANWLGEWGRFHSSELPLIEVAANASATVTHTLYLDCVYLGEGGGALGMAA